MRPGHALPFILALPLLGARPDAIHILLKMDAATAGVAAADASKLSAAFQAFAQRESLAEPKLEGDGWVLGIRIMPVRTEPGFLAAKAILRLSHLDRGKVSDSGVEESMSLITATDEKHWDAAIVGEAWSLAEKAGLVADHPVLSQRQWAKQAPHPEEARVAFGMPGIQPLNQPPMPKMADALPAGRGAINNLLDIDVDAQGKPEAVIGREGTDATLARLGAWIMTWTFEPAKVDGMRVPSRFPMRMLLGFRRKP